MGQNQFRCFYLAFYSVNGSLVIQDGHAGKVYIDGKLVYSCELVGKSPRAGGDTHGAMTWNKEYSFFGG